MGKQLHFREFVALIAVLFSLIAFGTDAMLPALPEISKDLGISDINQAQLIITVFVLGTGLGQLIMGPLSDAYGRKPILLVGMAIFIAASVWAWSTTGITGMLLARFVQGVGISAPRTVTTAMVRDLYAGRLMAQVISLAMMIFVLVPAVAPWIGQTIMNAFGWRSVYVSFILMTIMAAVWLGVRQVETHGKGARIPFNIKVIWASSKEVFSNRRVQISTICLTLSYGCIFSYLASSQQIYVTWLGVGDQFPLFFGGVALVSGSAGFINARLVVTLGMWMLSTFGFLMISVLSVVLALIIMADVLSMEIIKWLFVGWSVCFFIMLGLCFANLNALAMEPMGHIAGTASAIVGAVATVGSVVLATPIGQMFNGTALPFLWGVAVFSALGFLINLLNPRQV